MRMLFVAIILVIVLSGCLSNQKTYVCPDGAEVLNQIDCRVHQNELDQPIGKAPTPSTLANCPQECCVGQPGYQEKNCPVDYNCIQNKCNPTDSDKDGLYDYEERQLGTNLASADTDGDGLTDYAEVKVKHTNPLLVNTDGDRYNDAQDSDPTNKNSAEIKITRIGNVTTEANTGALLLAAGSCYVSACALSGILAVLGPDVWIYRNTWNFRIENVGNDYTSEYSADFVVYGLDKVYHSREEIESDPNVIKQEISSKQFNVGRIEAGQYKTQSFTQETTLREIPEKLIDSFVKQKGSTYGAIENEKYDKF